MRDLHGRVGEVQIDLVYPHLLKALGTTPRAGKERRMKPRTLRALKRVARPRRLAFLFAMTVGVLLLAHPGALAEDVFGNIGPAPQLPPGGLGRTLPRRTYSLDEYFSAISVGFTSGVDASGVAPMIAYFGAQVLWLITCFLANGVILLFTLAFNLDLLNR